MLISIITVESVFFFIMGIVALAKPSFVTSVFGEPQIGPDMRNEVRAVYGGFGLAIGVVLLLSLWLPEVRSGVLIAVGAALLGMAFGRFISFLLEPAVGKFPALFTLIEILLGGALFYAYWESTS